MQRTVVPLQEVSDLEKLALDLDALLSDPRNQDVANEFPGTVERYTGDVEKVYTNLAESAQGCVAGKKESFVAFCGEKAVGMSIVTITPLTPAASGIEASWPNLSGFVCNPFRRQGIGRLSLLRRLQAVQENFGGCAWTYVRQENAISHHLVTAVGFKCLGEIVREKPGHNLYSYSFQ